MSTLSGNGAVFEGLEPRLLLSASPHAVKLRPVHVNEGLPDLVGSIRLSNPTAQAHGYPLGAAGWIKVTNVGDATAAGRMVISLSASATPDPLGEQTPVIDMEVKLNLQPGQSRNYHFKKLLPLVDGDSYLIANIDSNYQCSESDEGNNTAVSGAIPEASFSLVTVLQYEDGSVELIDAIKPAGNGGGKGAGGPGYKVFGKLQTTPVTYVVNPTGSGLGDAFVGAAISASVEEWDYYTGTELFKDSYTIDPTATVGKDGKVAYSFGLYGDSGVIAVTYYWMTTGKQKLIREYDVMFNTTCTWGDATVNSSVMDLQSISTHETGHGLGLADLYQVKWSDQTMYGYSGYGQTYARTLESGDIAGVREIYGL